MKKSTKGALAAGAAAALLLGGAGSLAYWTATSSVTGGAITSGTLSLTAGTCGDWSYANGDDAGSPVALIVPGDAVTKQCTYTIGATGDHLSATISSPSDLTYTTTGGTPTTLDLTADATYDIGGTPISDGGTVTSGDDGKTLTATFEVTFPYGSETVNAEDTQGLTNTLDALTVTLTQDQGTANPN